MILKVNKDICEIKQNEVWNVGDYNVHTVQVELSEEFDGLVNKVRYFVEENSYDMLITDNIAEVPREATLAEGMIRIGVYGYDADTDILVQSTSPVNKYISSGTYTGEADNTEPITPTDKQQMETQIQQNADDIDDLKESKQDVLISGTNIKTINNESILGSGNMEIQSGEPLFINSPAYSITTQDITSWDNKADKSDIPDVSNFITNSVNNLLNYYLKSETYTKQEVNNLIGQIATLQFQVVSTLPQEGDSKYIYLVPSSNPKTQNVKDEYIWVNNNWEQIGSTQVDLTGYATESWVNTQISGFLTQTQIQALINTALSEYTETDPTVPSYVKNITQANITSWNNKSDFSGNYNDLSNKPTIPSEVTESTVSGWGFTKNTGTYSKPSGGIPKTDLASAVQTSLGKADTALQSISSSDVTSALGYTPYNSTNPNGYTSNVGTITGITMNGSSKGTSGVVNLGTVITAHQDISGKEDKANKVTSISESSTDTQYPSAKTLFNSFQKDIIPSYVIEESESVISKVFSHANLGRTIRFIAVSDSHNDSTSVSHSYTQVSNQHCGQAIKYITDRIAVDFVTFLGDATWAGVAGATYTPEMLRSDINQMNRFLADGYKGVPNIRVVGNHDQYLTNDSKRLFNAGAYNYFGRYCAGKKDTVAGYGYYDLENSKVRVIYLNTSDIVTGTSTGTKLDMSQTQKNWLCETLIDLNTKSNASSWKVLLFSHAPLDMWFNIDDQLLLAYTNGGTYGNYTFTNHDAKIIGNVHGHVHCYSYGYISNKIRRFTIPNSNFYDNNHYKTVSAYSPWTEQTTYPKTENSRTDTSFSVVTIDLDSETCYVDNYGAGYDRVFSVDYNSNIVPTAISNINYTGTTTVGSNIDVNSFTYTITYSDSSTESKTLPVTVSPTTILAEGSNTVEVSYTENNTTVSANITITGTPAPVVNLFVSTPQYVPTSSATSVDEVAIGGRIATSGAVKHYKEGGLVTRFIEANVGDVFSISTDASNEDTYWGYYVLFDANKAYIIQAGKGDSNWSWNGADKKSGTLTIPASRTNAKYIKFCLAYSSMSNITIYKQN